MLTWLGCNCCYQVVMGIWSRVGGLQYSNRKSLLAKPKTFVLCQASGILTWSTPFGNGVRSIVYWWRLSVSNSQLVNWSLILSIRPKSSKSMSTIWYKAINKDSRTNKSQILIIKKCLLSAAAVFDSLFQHVGIIKLYLGIGQNDSPCFLVSESHLKN